MACRQRLSVVEFHAHVTVQRWYEKSWNGTNSPWYEGYENSTDGTKNPWYETSTVRKVHLWYETSMVRIVYGTKSLVPQKPGQVSAYHKLACLLHLLSAFSWVHIRREIVQTYRYSK